MNSQKLIESIKAIVPLEAEEEKLISSYLTGRRIRKRQFLLHENQIAKTAAFVLSGCLRSYSIDENGFEHVLQFAPVNWWVSDMYSFISQKESRLNIDAILDSEVLLLSRENQLELFDKVPKTERYFRILTEKSLVSSHQRLLDNLSIPARKRYEKFCSVYPSLINKLPQKQIASFIGITPEFLSKIRGELHNSKKS